jgi:hypothetical protein
MRRAPLAIGLAALALTASPAAAAGSVTVGQLAPGTIMSCSKNFDFLQASSPDNAYVMPAAGVITSWTHRSQVGAGQKVSLKIFRKIGDPAKYQLVGRDGPHPVVASTDTTFPASIAVQAGDVLGITGEFGSVSIGCEFNGPGETASHTPSLADGGFADFNISTTNRLNVTAILNPTNTFTLGSIVRHKKKGTASLAVNLPNPGELTASGAGASATDAAVISKVVSAGATSLLIKATGKKQKTLNRTGKVKLSLAITYTPTGGDPSSQSVKVKLRKK